MQPGKTVQGAPSTRRLVIVVLGLGTWISLAALQVFHPEPRLFELGNFVGPTTKSLLQGGGLTVCTEDLGTPGNPICFHAGRMPLPSLTVALGIRLFGMHPLAVNLFKLLLLLTPLAAAISLACRRAVRARLSPRACWLTAGLLLLPFGITAFLADVVNLQVEEGYSYSMLALAVALLLYFNDVPGPAWLRAVAFAVAIDGMYLSKSSMVPASIVLLAAFCVIEKSNVHRGLALALVLAAPVGWAAHQHHASGRYSIGTSIDGMNFHKGNSPEFLDLYPPPPGQSLDAHDRDLNAGLHFSDEWSFNDFHQRAALAFMRTHPKDELRAAGRKLWAIFASVQKIGSSESHGTLKLVETAGLIAFRVLLWASIAGALWILGSRRAPKKRAEIAAASSKAAALTFLGVVAAVALPYLLGFAYTRHVSVLIYPSALMGCWLVSAIDQENSSRGPDRRGPDRDPSLRRGLSKKQVLEGAISSTITLGMNCIDADSSGTSTTRPAESIRSASAL